jgi:hypothetical protein
MPPTLKSFANKAAELVAKAHGMNEPLVLDSAEAVDPKSGTSVHRFRLAPAAKANGPASMVFLDHRGEPLEVTHALAELFDHHVLTAGAPASPAAPVTIQPDTNVLILNPGDTFNETITVTIPKNAGPAKADIYFLADTTGSMASILNAVQAGANSILASLNGLGGDLAFGVGNYRDFETSDPFAFQHQLSPTNATPVVTAAINAWALGDGGDTPEADLFALDRLAVPPGGSIGWRPASKRIVVWFGDAPGHDPICPAVSGGAAITEASVTAKLTAEGISVLAISTATPGLDDDPKSGAFGYNAKCGAPGGLPGQGTRIANATGGQFVTGINAGNIVNTIIKLVSAAVGAIQNVKLVPSANVAAFVTSISPAAGYGPLAGDQDHTLKFEVTFTGAVPCKPEAQVFAGTLDVVADGKVVASKKVEITVPACAVVYSVKFVCGEQPECDCECAPVQPGRYATEINIHNYLLKEVSVVKRFIPVVLAGAPTGREPRVASVRAEDKIVLPAQTATMDDCCRISALLFGGEAPSLMPLTIGVLEITASAPLAVTAVYTTSSLKDGGGVSIRVEQIARR